MTTDQWHRVRTLFQRALEQGPEHRAAFLSDECHGDETVRREVESLLAAEAAAGPFLEAPAFRVQTDAAVAIPALRAGDRVGSFEVIDVLGRGGMGEVYRARDVKLAREVAIKVLPRALAADPQRLARFDRESRILASFNHPHIAAIHSVEQVDGLRLLVLELIEGPTLADRLRAGPLPPHEALAIAQQLATALEAAHDQGVVHRDLKPANIKLTSSGIKLLDFGLAKEQVVRDATGASLPVADGTIDGLILGTCAYMSPEQARGKPTDKRTDIWAFGCVLFEMLVGQGAFRGDSPSDTIAAVLEHEPDWSRLPAAMAPGVGRLLRRCLEKDPDRRLHDVADARIEIEDALSNRGEVPAGTRWPARALALTAAVTLFAGGMVFELWRDQRTPSEQPIVRTTRFTWALPAGIGLDSPPTISPDGQLIAFAGRSATDGRSRLYVRALNELQVKPVASTEDAKHPFWSPDSRSLAYFARGKLMKVALDGGAAVEMCAAPDGRGGAWSATGVIVFSPVLIESGLMRVPANGGPVEPATVLDREQGENSHRWPVFLPDGLHFLYFARGSSPDRRGVYLGRVDRPASPSGTLLLRSESEALYVPADGADQGLLLTAASGRIEARPFDARRRLLTGDPRIIDLPTAASTPHHAMMLSASADVIAHTGSSVPLGARLASIGRNGENPAASGERGIQGWPRLSPDGRRLAWTRVDPTSGTSNVWVEDLVRGTRVPTSTSQFALLPVWSPDGERLAHAAGSVRARAVTISRSDGTGVASTVACPGDRCEATDWSHDARWLIATVYSETDQDVWMLPVSGDGAARPLLTQPFAEHDARLSPDGRLVAYVSGESGRREVSVQTMDPQPRREVISVAGGDQPVWSRNGRELFFVDPQGLLRAAHVSIGADGRPLFGPPVLVRMPPIGSGHWGTQYDISPDGRRIFFFDRRLDPPPSEFGVVVGWRAMLK